MALSTLDSAAAAGAPKRVLIVQSFANAAPPFSTTSIGFETTLTEEMGERVDLDEVSLGMARYADEDMQEALVEFLQKRQAKWQPDLVVPIGSPAGVFVAQYRDRLFPQTPILFTGMDQRRLPPGSLPTNVAFVGQNMYLPGFVEDILQIAPATTNIVVVIGASTLEQYWKTALVKEFESFTNRVGFTWLNELSFDQMLDRVSKLPPRSFIFLALLVRDATGVTHNADEALKRIHEVANAPVNGIFDSQLGMGIVGGRLYQAGAAGSESARIAIRILHGEPAGNFPPRAMNRLTPGYDWRELRRWNIGKSLLPPGSVVQFREPTLWELYRNWFITGISAGVVAALLIAGLVANVVRRRRAERLLTESGNRLRAILDTAVEGIITINDDGVIESVNSAAGRIFGYTADEMIGRDVGMLELPSFRDGLDGPHLNGRRREESPANGNGREVRGRRKDGSTFPLELAVNGIPLAGRRILTGFVRDITERKQAERSAREFGGRLLQAQEAERARLARELHDDITQRMARLAIDAGRAESGRDESRPGETMRLVREGLVQLSEDIHTLSYRLHPSLLGDLGLEAALRAECERFSRQDGIQTEVKAGELPEKIPHAAALALFRVAQEALRNVARHAGARAATVTLQPVVDGLLLAVMDSGAGFDPRRQKSRPSLGLASMRERMRLLGGELEIESAPGQGTTILAWVPLEGVTA